MYNIKYIYIFSSAYIYMIIDYFLMNYHKKVFCGKRYQIERT